MTRPPLQTRRQSLAPRLTAPACLLLRARSFLKASAIADVWAALLAKEEGSASSLADLTGYTHASVSAVLGGLVESGICLEERRKSGKWYRFLDREAWKRVLGLGLFPPWPNWRRFYEALLRIATVWNDTLRRNASDYILAGESRSYFIEVKNDLLVAGIIPASRSPDLYLANEFLPPFRKYINELFAKARFLPPSG